MPKLRAEQIQSQSLSDLQIAVNAAIKQSKIANAAADPTGWITKGTVTVVENFDTFAAGYQEFGLSIGDGSGNSGLKPTTIYYFDVNGVEYSINTTGQSEPISYNTVISLMDAALPASLSISLVSGDIRITNANTGFDKNVIINPNCSRHRLHDHLIGFTAFDTPVSGTGITWAASLAGRLFYDSTNDQLRIATKVDPYYQIIPVDGSWDGVTTLRLAGDVSGFPLVAPAKYRFISDEQFSLDGSDLFVYYNGLLLALGDDYTIIDTSTIELDVSYTTGMVATDRVTMLVYKSAPLSQYASKIWVEDYVSGNATADFNQLLNVGSIQNGKDLIPANNGEVDLGDSIHRFGSGYFNNVTLKTNLTPIDADIVEVGSAEKELARIYTNEVLFKPLAEIDDFAQIVCETSGSNTIVRHEIGRDAGDQIIFAANNGSSIDSLLTISGDGNVTIPGNLTVNGTTVYIDSENSQVSDSDVLIKFANPGTDGDASISVRRAKTTTEGDNDAQLKWNETTDKWEAGKVGSTAELMRKFTSSTSGEFYSGTTDPTNTTRINYDGYLYATRVYNAVWNDLAEFMPKALDAEPGMVLVQTEYGVAPCSNRGDAAVVGVYSDTFGYALGAENQENKLPVGISGRVKVWIEEPCKIGDLLITSSKIGFATVKRTGEDGQGKIFAKVMEKKEDSTPARVWVMILMA